MKKAAWFIGAVLGAVILFALCAGVMAGDGDKKYPPYPTVTVTKTITVTPTITATPRSTASEPIRRLADQLKTSSPSPRATRSTPKASPTRSRTTTPRPRVTTQSPEYFSNCPEMRRVYPNGVRRGHPAYRSALDRNKNNHACERN